MSTPITVEYSRAHRPTLFKRLSLHDNLIQLKSEKVQTPPLQWSFGVHPMSSLSRSKSAPTEEKEEAAKSIDAKEKS